MRRYRACGLFLVGLAGAALVGCAPPAPAPVLLAPKPAATQPPVQDARLLARIEQLEGRLSELRMQLQAVSERTETLRVDPTPGNPEVAAMRAELTRLRVVVQESITKLDNICIRNNNLGTRIISAC